MIGLDIFREAPGEHEDKFILIGGMAAALQADEVGLTFRATKDYDLVLILEALDKGFFDAFWAFVKAGRYSAENASGKRQLYRFRNPQTPGYPWMIELLSRKPDLIELPPGMHFSPIPADADGSSLSAILLNPEYYECLLRGRTMVNGIPVLSVGMLIPIKAKAYHDLEQRLREGQKIKAKDVAKHRADVFFILEMLVEGDRIDITGAVQGDLAEFLDKAAGDAAFDLSATTGVAKADAIARMKTIYGLA
jgi:hypothetical protein